MRLINWIKFLWISNKFTKNIRVNYAIDAIKKGETRYMCVALQNHALINPRELKGFNQVNFDKFIKTYYPQLSKHLASNSVPPCDDDYGYRGAWCTSHKSDMINAKIKFLKLFC